LGATGARNPSRAPGCCVVRYGGRRPVLVVSPGLSIEASLLDVVQITPRPAPAPPRRDHHRRPRAPRAYSSPRSSRPAGRSMAAPAGTACRRIQAR